jgi:hypothetical protein
MKKLLLFLILLFLIPTTALAGGNVLWLGPSMSLATVYDWRGGTFSKGVHEYLNQMGFTILPAEFDSPSCGLVEYYGKLSPPYTCINTVCNGCINLGAIRSDFDNFFASYTIDYVIVCGMFGPDIAFRGFGAGALSNSSAYETCFRTFIYDELIVNRGIPADRILVISGYPIDTAKYGSDAGTGNLPYIESTDDGYVNPNLYIFSKRLPTILSGLGVHILDPMSTIVEDTVTHLTLTDFTTKYLIPYGEAGTDGYYGHDLHFSNGNATAAAGLNDSGRIYARKYLLPGIYQFLGIGAGVKGGAAFIQGTGAE